MMMTEGKNMANTMKKAIHCTGSLQAKNGYWYTVIQVTDNGIRKSKWETTRLPIKGNKVRAQSILMQRIPEYEKRYVSAPMLEEARKNDPLFSDYLEKWTEQQRPNVSYATTAARRHMVKGRIRTYFDDREITLKTLTAAQIEDFYETMRAADLKGSTLVHYHQFMNQALEAAVKKDLLARNPMYKVDRPRKNLFVGSYYSREEVEKLLEVLKDDPLYPMVFVDVYYGLRRSELLGLEWDSVDFVRNTLSVEHKVYRDNENGDDRDISISSELKTRNSRRTLPLIPAVREVLEAEKKKQERYRKIFKAEYIGKYSKMVFVDPVGNLYTPDYVTRHFEVVLKSNGLRPIRFHDLRHTCASLLVAQGVDMKLIQLWLGHANYSTTADIYAHLDAGAQDVTAGAIVQALEKKRK